VGYSGHHILGGKTKSQSTARSANRAGKSPSQRSQMARRGERDRGRDYNFRRGTRKIGSSRKDKWHVISEYEQEGKTLPASKPPRHAFVDQGGRWGPEKAGTPKLSCKDTVQTTRRKSEGISFKGTSHQQFWEEEPRMKQAYGVKTLLRGPQGFAWPGGTIAAPDEGA